MVAANANNSLTLLDLTKRTDPNGEVPIIAELLSQKNDILIDMPWKEGNLPTGTRNTVRTGLPTVYFKRANAGNAASKSELNSSNLYRSGPRSAARILFTYS